MISHTLRQGMAGADDHNAFHDDLGPDDESSIISVCYVSSLSAASGVANVGVRQTAALIHPTD